jgi:ubiquinone/menaquinone biosynthesis C-methylase UbiE
MASTGLPADVVDLLRDQQTLGRLEDRPDGLYSAASGLTYPVRDGIVFMGFDAQETQWMQETMEEERLWQGTPASVQQDLEYLRGSAPGLVDVINLIDKLGAAGSGRRLIDVGSGSGWGSRLFAAAGYDPWMVDFEPNSLWLGGLYEHPALGPGKRIVADASLMPFADGTFDVALVKEFAHHVDDKDRLFAEINRVLRPGGLLVLIEPTHNLWVTVQRLRGNDPDEGHTQHDITWPETYLRSLSRNGMRTFWRGRHFPEVAASSKITQAIKQRALDTLRSGKVTHDPISWVHEHLAGGDGYMIVLARKDVAVNRRRDAQIRVVDPAGLVATQADRDVFIPLRDVLDDAARGLTAAARA